MSPHRIVLLAATLTAASWAVVLASCATPGILHPKVGPGTDFPCGVTAPDGRIIDTGTTCAHGWCCSDGETCGGRENGSISCPAQTCCFNGIDNGLLGTRSNHPMREMR